MNRQSLFKSTLSTDRRWFETWLRHFGAPGQSGFWRTGHGGALVEIPYVLETLYIGGFPLRCARGAVNAHTPRYDILGTLGTPAEVLTSMMDDLGAAMLRFPYLSPESELLHKTQANPGSLLIDIGHCERAPYIDTASNWDEYWSSRGKSRLEWARKERKLLGNDDTKVVCLTQWDAIEPIFTDILEIEASGWKGQQGSAIVQDRNLLTFYTELSRYWAEQGWLRLFILYAGALPVAFELDAEFNGILHIFKHGYLESWAKSGPGQVLRMQVLRSAFENDGVQLADMFGPSTDFKGKWATHDEELQTLTVYRKSPAGLLAWCRYAAAPRLKARIRGSNRVSVPG